MVTLFMEISVNSTVHTYTRPRVYYLELFRLITLPKLVLCLLMLEDDTCVIESLRFNAVLDNFSVLCKGRSF